MSGKPELSDLDLQLYLVGALPFSRRLLFLFAWAVNGRLRGRLRALRNENLAYRKVEMGRLKSRLFPAPSPAFKITPTRPPFWNVSWAGAMVLLALAALPVLRPDILRPDQIRPDAKNPDNLGPARDPEAFAAKGRGLGVTLFVKGDSAYRVENHTASITPTDTLQVMPLGSEPQQMVLVGWDDTQGLVRLYPKEGAYSHRVSAGEPPPALLLQGMSDNRLICVTATSPFRVDEILGQLNRKPYRPIVQAPASRLLDGHYVQIFSISKKARRI